MTAVRVLTGAALLLTGCVTASSPQEAYCNRLANAAARGAWQEVGQAFPLLLFPYSTAQPYQQATLAANSYTLTGIMAQSFATIATFNDVKDRCMMLTRAGSSIRATTDPRTAIAEAADRRQAWVAAYPDGVPSLDCPTARATYYAYVERGTFTIEEVKASIAECNAGESPAARPPVADARFRVAQPRATAMADADARRRAWVAAYPDGAPSLLDCTTASATYDAYVERGTFTLDEVKATIAACEESR